MKVVTLLGRAAALLALTALAAAAQANSTIAQLTGTTPSVTDVTFTSNGTGGGTLVTSDGGVAVMAIGPIGGAGDTFASFLNFGPITQTGAAQSVGGVIVAPFSSGVFSIWTGSGNTGTLLLNGTFTSSTLTSASGSSGSILNFGLNSVTYTGGLFRTEFIALNGGPPVIGNLALSLASINPPVTILGNGGLTSFSASADSGTFDATAGTVPEPSERAFAGLAVSGLGGLMVRTRRRMRGRTTTNLIRA